MEDNESYGLGKVGSTKRFEAPLIEYMPPKPRHYKPSIALIGCGGISEQHLIAYTKAGWNISVLCDVNREKAEGAKHRFNLSSRIEENWENLINDDEIDVVDLAVHPRVRDRMFEPFINRKKHILSQKPFVTDIARGEEIVAKARDAGIKLAVNQNGRWSPHYSYIRGLIDEGALGDIQAIRHSISWDHTWTKGTPFEDIHFLILYDFGIHWFDLLACFLKGRKVNSIYAKASFAAGQDVKPPFLSSVIFDYEGGQASIDFNALTRYGQEDRTLVIGNRGTVESVGLDLLSQKVTFSCESGQATPELKGSWFPDGFVGSMGELLCGIEENREPSNNAADNLLSLRFCFAALKSAKTGRPVDPYESGLSIVK
ncbi:MULTISPECIES: Gfo/Idh/MocA family protein [unclassified Oceanispirochaeta]|uniref:Gfo/Idh/MocA family protein n=1 Tax=unclassified Oceanispirochaeta TaxID=2635722 RepID=UPI000E094D36|nr:MULTISPECIES: Gfo/Idh/MocA family oxidoreductase [unclassified Oceanispirochaeta]MBF9017447.1 Gfo/Idh/MocA family oxidoreductase [Oceanispirochaeta sp. M2]NPD74019.1 Gfo/Idh/MocA family oxidoreductase [Oceanispirochaeta sp. M1]RDG30189.1 gfo/Idh/MocA family oxidoreductase [Oceanispirochaeta sp. M1]